MPEAIDPAALRERLSKIAPGGGAPDRESLFNRLKSSVTEKPAEKPTSLWESLKQGVVRGGRDVVESASSLAARVPTGEGMTDYARERQQMIESTGRQSQQSNQAYDTSPGVAQHPIASGLGRAAGNIAAAAPAMAVPGVGAMGMGGRSAVGALQGGVTGGVPGAIAGAVTGPLGAVVGPPVSQAFQKIATEIPQLAQMATGALGRTPEAFQKSFSNWVLDPIKEVVGPKVKVGSDLVNYVGDKISDVYRSLLPKVTFRAAEVDPTTQKSFQSGLANLAARVPTAHEKDFQRLLQKEIIGRLDEGGNMSGQEYQKALSSIGRDARQYSGPKGNVDQERYGEVLHDLQAEMRETLAAHNPEQSASLRAADTAWARYVRLEEAAGRRIDSNGQFMPNDVLHAARKGYGNRIFAHGEQIGQKFGIAGNDLLAGRPPNWTSYIADAAGAAIGGGIGHRLGGAMGAGVGAAAGGALGHTLGRRAVEALGNRTSGPVARKTGEMISRIGAPAVGAAAPGVDRVRERLKASQKVGELSNQRYQANRRGDIEEVEAIGRKLAEAHREYRELGGTA